MYKYGFGFVISGIFLLLFPGVVSAGLGLLVVTAPLASSSMWAKQNLIEFPQEKVSQKFDLEFADDLFTNSFGISLILNFLIFSIGESVVNPNLLLIIGLLIIGSSLMVIASVLYYRARKSARREQLMVSEVSSQDKVLINK